MPARHEPPQDRNRPPKVFLYIGYTIQYIFFRLMWLAGKLIGKSPERPELRREKARRRRRQDGQRPAQD